MMNPLTLLKQAFFVVIFVAASCVVAFFHALSTPLLLFGCKHAQRRIVGFFTHLHWGIVVGYATWVGKYKLNLVADEDTLKDFNKFNSLWLLNHRYQVEWIGLQIIGKYFGMLENMKGVGKHSLLCLPIVGWTLFFNEFLLVKRNYSKDKTIIERNLKSLSTIKDPFAFIIFCEGTRFTKEKHEASMEFAKKNDYPLLRHHLLPRTKGFHVLGNGMKDFVPYVFCATICFQGGRDPTLVDFMNLEPISGDMLIRRIPINQVPEDEKECGDFVRKLYVEKDELCDFYKKNNHFPIESWKQLENFKTMEMKRSISSLAILIGWPVFFVCVVCLLTSLELVNSAPILIGIGTIMAFAICAFVAVLSLVNTYSSYGR